MALRYLPNVTTLRLNAAKCVGCSMCAAVCPHAVWVMNEKKAHLVDRAACMECGACARNCAEGAISVKAGVGCAAAVLHGMLSGGSPECGCSSAADSASPCCAG